MLYLLCILFFLTGCFYAFRYFALRSALRALNRELLEIRKDISQNRILHLPLPDRSLEKFTESVNGTLEQIRGESRAFAEREREFQRQIEDISHDLRTPLTVILGYLKWMKSGAARDASFTPEESLQAIEQNARVLERLVSQFYTFSRLSGPDCTLQLQETDLCRLVRESLAANYRSLEEASIRPDSMLPGHPVLVRGNQEALERIFANLFQNAGRYAHSYLRVRMEESGDGRVRVLLENDSQELREEDIPRLFRRFYQNDPARSRNGSGLGLAIAKSLAEMMGGSLTAEPVREPALPRSSVEAQNGVEEAPAQECSLPSPSARTQNGVAEAPPAIIGIRFILSMRAECISSS